MPSVLLLSLFRSKYIQAEWVSRASTDADVRRMALLDHNFVAKVKRCIMERDLYPKKWGHGEHASKKRDLKAAGKLDKYGRPNEATPADWLKLNAEPAAVSAPAPTPANAEPATTETEAPAPEKAADADAEKKRKKHEGETPEERAERKRAKKEKRKSQGAAEAA